MVIGFIDATPSIGVGGGGDGGVINWQGTIIAIDILK